MKGNSSKLDVLITVKGYPNPSKKLREAACIAGIDRKGKHVRLYPIPFRDLESEKCFNKYQWIRLKVQQPKNDPRPESYRPDLDTLEVISTPLSTENAWHARKNVVLPLVKGSLCDIQDVQERDGTSLGIFKPAEVLDFDWELEETPKWSSEELAKLDQRDMFMTRDKKLLEKIPYSFRYRFRCEGCRTKKPHHLKIIDWELAQQYLKFVRRYPTVDVALQKLKDNWLGRLCGKDKDTYFFTGNMQQFPSSFLVLGVFWPPRETQKLLVF